MSLNYVIDFERVMALLNPSIFLPIWKWGRPNNRFCVLFRKYNLIGDWLVEGYMLHV